MDFCNERLDHQVNFDQSEFSFSIEGIDTTDYLTHQSATIAELNINRSYDDLLDVSTTYLGTDLVQRTDVFNVQPSFPITFDCHTNGIQQFNTFLYTLSAYNLQMPNSRLKFRKMMEVFMSHIESFRHVAG